MGISLTNNNNEGPKRSAEADGLHWRAQLQPMGLVLQCGG